MANVTYDRPVSAKLMVELSDGSKFEAKAEDVSKFGYVNKLDAYMNFNNHLTQVLSDAGILDRDLTNAMINPIRYIVELAITYPELLSHHEMADVNADIVKIENCLKENLK